MTAAIVVHVVAQWSDDVDSEGGWLFVGAGGPRRTLISGAFSAFAMGQARRAVRSSTFTRLGAIALLDSAHAVVRLADGLEYAVTESLADLESLVDARVLS